MATIKSRKHSELTYLDGVVQDEGFIYPVMGNLRLPAEGIKFYGDSLVRISTLEPCALIFYFWCLMEMSNVMVVSTDVYQRNRFLSFTKTLGIVYKDVSVMRGIKSLCRMELIIKLTNSRYKINPEYCYKGREQDRKVEIKQIRRNNKTNSEYELRGEEIVKKES